jgi:hypothetical protein
LLPDRTRIRSATYAYRCCEGSLLVEAQRIGEGADLQQAMPVGLFRARRDTSSHVRRRFYELAQAGPAPIAAEALVCIAET